MKKQFVIISMIVLLSLFAGCDEQNPKFDFVLKIGHKETIIKGVTRYTVEDASAENKIIITFTYRDSWGNTFVRTAMMIDKNTNWEINRKN